MNPLDAIVEAAGREPYFRDDAVVIYHGDALELVPLIGAVQTVSSPTRCGLTRSSSASLIQRPFSPMYASCWTASALSFISAARAILGSCWVCRAVLSI